MFEKSLEKLEKADGVTGFTIKPMINEGTWAAVVLDDGSTAVTKDGKLLAQFEHTVAVTKDEMEILTFRD